jgi:hypothetical protein
MARGCCGPKNIRIIRVGNSKAGVTGLDQILEDTLRQGWSPDQEGLTGRCLRPSELRAIMSPPQRSSLIAKP